MVDAVHVDGFVVVFELVEGPGGGVVARRVAWHRRAEDQRQRLRVREVGNQRRGCWCHLRDCLRGLDGHRWEAEWCRCGVVEGHRTLSS